MRQWLFTLRQTSRPSRARDLQRALLWRQPDRRLELVILAAIYAALMLALWSVRAREDVAPGLALLTLEVMLPAALGTLLTGTLAGDRAMDLVLSAPYPQSLLLTGRLAMLLLPALILSGLSQALISAWSIPLPVSGTPRLLIWATPTIWMAGVALVTSLLSGRRVIGVLTLFALIGLMIAVSTIFDQLCPGAKTEPCPTALAYPFMTMQRPGDPLWPLNRVLWIGCGLGLLTIAVLWPWNEERLCAAAHRDDEGE